MLYPAIIQRLNKIAVALLCAPLLALSIVPIAYAQPNYGAISYSEGTREHGFSFDFQSRGEAEARALSECEQAAGSGDCYVLIWFRNACGALAESPGGGFGSGWGSERAVAEQYALESCNEFGQQCTISQWVCTTQ